MCPAGGRDGQGVSLLCHPATHAYVCITAPKPGRRRGGGYSPWQLSRLSAVPPSSRTEWGWDAGGFETGASSYCPGTLGLPTSSPSSFPPSPEKTPTPALQTPSAQAWAWHWSDTCKALSGLRKRPGQGPFPLCQDILGPSLSSHPPTEIPQPASHRED